MQPPRKNTTGQLFRILAGLWVFPSAGALTILVCGAAQWQQRPNHVRGLEDITFERWLALGILFLQVVFVALAWRGRNRQRPKP